MKKLKKLFEKLYEPTIMQILDNDALVVLRSLEEPSICLTGEQKLLKQYFSTIIMKRKKV